jgi:hypothetical protein
MESEESQKLREEQAGQELERELEKARAEVALAAQIQQKNLIGTLVYGGPMTRKWKKCLEWVRHDLTTTQDSPILREVFEFSAPLHWAFYLHPERGWLKYDLREMFGQMKRDTEVAGA